MHARRLSTTASLVALLVMSLVLPVSGCGQLGVDELDGTRWLLVGWSAETDGPERFIVTLAFEDGQAVGQAPVNSYGGEYATTRAGGFAVGQIAQTLMAGPPEAMEAESTYFELLRAASEYRIDDGRLVLSSEEESELLVFVEELRYTSP